MSATIDQLRFRATSPRKTKAKPIKMLERAKKNVAKMKMEERIRPEPQIMGSDLGYFSRSQVLRSAPRGTPNIPETIVTAPKMIETLKGQKIVKSVHDNF